MWGKGNTKLQPPLGILLQLRGAILLRSTGDVHSPRHRLTKTLRPNPRTKECLHPPCCLHTPSHSITKHPFTTVPYTQHITSIFQQKVTRYTKGKKHNLKKPNKPSEPKSCMARMLELAGQKFFKNMITMLRALTETVDSMQKWMVNVN